MSKITIFAGLNAMRKINIHRILRSFATAVAAMILASCSHDWLSLLNPDLGLGSGNNGDRTPNEESRKVMLLYSAGFNSLASYLKDDIKDLKGGWLPAGTRRDDVVLIYSHFPEAGSGYSRQTSPTLVRIYTRESNVIADTLVVYPEGTISASAGQLNNVLTYIKDNFQAKSYGMIFSSHATGYLPTGYYQHEDSALTDDIAPMSLGRNGFRLTSAPYVEPEHDPSLPMVKSIGQDQVGTSGAYTSYEIELADFADAIPMELDYILFDACLMGGVEVAYELKDKVRKIGFSQTEVLAEGFCYGSLTTHLLNIEESDPVSVCRDYFNQYDVQTGVYQSATISLIDCTRMEPLAELCRTLFDKYSENLSKIRPGDVQKFFRSGRHWFYDLESILVNAGIDDAELADLHDRLDDCVLYKAHTPRFMSEFDIRTFSGFSMYLPCNGSRLLDNFYTTLKWNQATGLVD